MSGHYDVRSFVYVMTSIMKTMNMLERIETERLVLRKLRVDDAPVLFIAYMQDPEVTRYTTWRPHQQLQEAEDFVRSSISAWENGTRFP